MREWLRDWWLAIAVGAVLFSTLVLLGAISYDRKQAFKTHCDAKRGTVLYNGKFYVCDTEPRP